MDGAEMKTSKVSDPDNWPSAFEVLHFATPEDAKKAQALFYSMACAALPEAKKAADETFSKAAGKGPTVEFNVKEIAWLCNLYAALRKWRNTIFVGDGPEPTTAEIAQAEAELLRVWEQYQKETSHKTIGTIATEWITEKIVELGDPEEFFQHKTPCPCTQLPHSCGLPVPTTGQEELARQIYGMAHRRTNRKHKVAQIAEYLREIMANCMASTKQT